MRWVSTIGRIECDIIYLFGVFSITHANLFSKITAGLGKTLQTISLICHLKETEDRTGPSVVICPLSVLESWYNEIKRWAPSLKVLRLHANSKQLTEVIKRNMTNADEGGFLSSDVVVTTYDVAKSASTKSLWARLRFNLCVLDEGHIIKNHQSLIAQGVRRIHSEGKLLLSGTPTQNNLVELWSILNYLYPEFFTDGDSRKIFASAFDISKNQVDSNLLNSVHEMLRLFMLRRMKSEVEKLMPKKVETRVSDEIQSMRAFSFVPSLSSSNPRPDSYVVLPFFDILAYFSFT